MGTQLAIIATVSSPVLLPSLPEWVKQRSAAVASAAQPDSTGKHREMTVLPASLILNSSERAMVEAHIAGLAMHLSLGQHIVIREKTLSNDQAHGVMIASLLIKGGGAKLDQASADALTEDYLDAIEDLPAWAVREAVRKWNRAESQPLDGKKHDFNWRPQPPTLRRLAQIEMVPIKARIHNLEKLLTAVPLMEFSDEHRENMLKRLQVVIHDAAKEPTIISGDVSLHLPNGEM
jgi:hypothetical protein